MPKLHQRLHRNLGRAERKLRTLWIQHPGRNGQITAIAMLAYGAFTTTPFYALVNAQRLAEKGMPTIVDRDSLNKMGII